MRDLRDGGEAITVAITGLNATDNPGPGVSVIRALRASADFRGRVVGLAYDALEPGIFARDLIDDVFLVPYPSAGVGALAARLEYIHERVPLSAIIPTLDAELPSFIDLAPRLAEMGIGTFLPSREQFELRAKTNLATLGAKAGIAVPPSRAVGELAALYSVHHDVPYPFFVKGVFYGAELARGIDDAVRATRVAFAAIRAAHEGRTVKMEEV